MTDNPTTAMDPQAQPPALPGNITYDVSGGRAKK